MTGIKNILNRDGFMKKIIRFLAALLVILVIACGSGFLAARFMVGEGKSESPGEGNVRESFAFVPFESVLVNLAEERLTRYLKVKIMLKVEEQHEEACKEIMESGKKAVYMDWLITYLSGLKLEQVKGSESIRRLKGEIRTGLNLLLRNDTEAQIEEVLFEEFNVQ